MAKVLVTEGHLNNIAEAIRSKNGASTTYRPGDMAAAIQAIPTGGITPTGTVNITQNGTHDVTQYASANVNVPNSYAAGDEGKVVSNGALVAQTAHAEVTQNGTIDTTLNNSVTVNVSGGGGGLPSAYKSLIDEASLMVGKQEFPGNIGYNIKPSTIDSMAPIPTGITACSAEVYYDCKTVGYLIGFGSMSTRRVFSFTPESFVSYSDDHNFQNTYTGENHLVVVYDGNTTVYVYANGSLAETIQLGGTINIGVGYFFQGKWAATQQSVFKGTIYHTAVWKRALTAQEVATLYQNRDSIAGPDVT